ncbi:MAG: hypothetical protein KDE04_20550 [Anaerolineales bacterium]|nr:hypothetical protein [Anaerolineales bacterium]
MRLVQLEHQQERRVAQVLDNDRLQLLSGLQTVFDLAREAYRYRRKLVDVVTGYLSRDILDYGAVIEAGELILPLDHPDPAHCHVTGTGLTHLGSAEARDAMHAAKVTNMTDSMRLFQMGLAEGKPAGSDNICVQPEWFYKGNGFNLAPPGGQLAWPAYGLDGGEEAELVGLYLIADRGTVLRVGFALGNEYSDHVMEAQNYLYLAHSKLRTCSFGPELLVGELPADIRGEVSVERAGATIWQAPFLTGEANMSYHIAGLEHHHFKYELFRQPGDVHVHFFGTATISRNAGITTQPGDRFVIAAPGFGRPLINEIGAPAGPEQKVTVHSL